MKEILNKVHTPEGWKQNLYKEIERKSFKTVFRIPNWVYQLIVGAFAVCAAVAIAIILVPKGYSLLLTSGELSRVIAERENIRTNMYTNTECTHLKEYFPPDLDINSENGRMPVELYATMPVRVIGDNIESVTFIPKDVTMVAYSYYDDIKKYDNEEIVVSEITIPYDEQFKLDYILELKWEATDVSMSYDMDKGAYTHIYSPGGLWKNINDSSIEIQINMKNGTVKTETIDVSYTYSEYNPNDYLIKYKWNKKDKNK